MLHSSGFVTQIRSDVGALVLVALRNTIVRISVPYVPIFIASPESDYQITPWHTYPSMIIPIHLLNTFLFVRQ